MEQERQQVTSMHHSFKAALLIVPLCLSLEHYCNIVRRVFWLLCLPGLLRIEADIQLGYYNFPWNAACGHKLVLKGNHFQLIFHQELLITSWSLSIPAKTNKMFLTFPLRLFLQLKESNLRLNIWNMNWENNYLSGLNIDDVKCDKELTKNPGNDYTAHSVSRKMTQFGLWLIIEQ